MYLSSLLIDIGTNPDRPRPGRIWLRNLYRVHQRLCMAFPSPTRTADDPDFLAPYRPEDFGAGHVHVERKADAGFLFRVDPGRHGRAAILVQSATEPDWDYAFHNAPFLVAAESRPYAPDFGAGRRLRFRLAANPVRRVRKDSRNAKGEPVAEKWIGSRVPVPADKLGDWLHRRAEPNGFAVASVASEPGYVYVGKGSGNGGQRLRSVRYDGLLTVTNPVDFRKAVVSGIGPAKAFGFGLLSVAP